MFKFQCSSDIEPAQEGILDSLAYMFTSDKAIAEKLGNMIHQLEKIGSDDQKAFESLPIGRKIQKFENLKRLMGYSAKAIDFVETNIKKYESMSYGVMDSDRKKIQDEIDQVVGDFENDNQAKEMHKLMSDVEDKEDATYAQLGYTFSNFMEIAKEFKDSQSGRLAKLRKMRIITYTAATEIKDWKIRVVHDATYRFNDLLGTGITVYKYVDKFLFYTYRKLLHENIITE